MNTYQAKRLDLPDLLDRLSFQPVKIKKGGNELWYVSPFRDEHSPSFHVSKGYKWPWVWKDFGDIGGTVLDFVMRYQDYTHVAEALSFLDAMYGSASKSISSQKPSSFHQPSKDSEPAKDHRKLEFISAGNIQHKQIYTYLQGRGISKELADLYLQEISYRNVSTGKKYFAFGMKNESIGYEIRVASDAYGFKSALIARDISYLPGVGEECQKKVNVFEGMTDFLSLLVIKNQQRYTEDSIVMHSLSSFQKCTAYIIQRGYLEIHTYLDNNRAGAEHTCKFRTMFRESMYSHSHEFAPHVDLNDALRAKTGTNIVRKK